MPSSLFLVDTFAAATVLAGATLAFAQKHRYIADAPPSYYRRMIAGIMMAAFGLILAIFATTYAIETA